MEGFRLVETERGRAAWTVHARRADLLENKEAQLTDVEAVFTNPDGRTAALIGELGTLDTVSGNASIRRGAREVRIVTSDGYLMTTDSLSWKARDRLVRTNDPFKVLGREIYVEGKGMTADVDLEELAVNDNVKAILQE
jgi:lipopolysaccharide export system protein LptC